MKTSNRQVKKAERKAQRKAQRKALREPQRKIQEKPFPAETTSVLMRRLHREDNGTYALCFDQQHFHGKCVLIADDEIREFTTFLINNPTEGHKWTKNQATQLNASTSLRTAKPKTKIRNQMGPLTAWLRNHAENIEIASPVSLLTMTVSAVRLSPTQQPSARIPLPPVSQNICRVGEPCLGGKSEVSILAELAPERAENRAFGVEPIPEEDLVQAPPPHLYGGLSIAERYEKNRVLRESKGDHYNREDGKFIFAEALLDTTTSLSTISAEYNISCGKFSVLSILFLIFI